MIERRILIGLITSTEFIQQIHAVWDTTLLASAAAQRLATWCIEHYEKYNTAPGRDIEGIYYDQLKTTRISPQLAEEIEQDILPSLSEEYEEGINLNYLLDQTRRYLNERRLARHVDTIHAHLEAGEVSEAERLATTYTPKTTEAGQDIDLSNPATLQRVEKAFTTTAQPVLMYPRQLGAFMNSHLVRGGFVGFMASEKRGKTFWLLDMSLRAVRQKTRVAFFQAGDMTEDQQLRRIAIYLTRKNTLEKYSGVMWQPVRDCIRNQRDTCTRDERECNFGVFTTHSEEQLRAEIDIQTLKEAHSANPDYKPCTNCPLYEQARLGLGTPWIEQVDTGDPLTVDQAITAYENYFIRYNRRFKLSTYPTGTLTVREIKTRLDVWEREDGFVADMIVIDYADLLAVERVMDYRHAQNEIWKCMRNLSQERHALVVTATQADAASYDRDTLTLKNFSEDKRKYAHVTAMFGLNQDRKDREKNIGLMRINELVIREGAFSARNEVRVLQNLQRGRPMLSSMW